MSSRRSIVFVRSTGDVGQPQTNQRHSELLEIHAKVASLGPDVDGCLPSTKPTFSRCIDAVVANEASF